MLEINIGSTYLLKQEMYIVEHLKDIQQNMDKEKKNLDQLIDSLFFDINEYYEKWDNGNTTFEDNKKFLRGIVKMIQQV